jgi:hypothetical protein
MSILSVYIRTADKMGLIWKFGENVGDIWNGAAITIPRISNYDNFTFVFEGDYKFLFSFARRL